MDDELNILYFHLNEAHQVFFKMKFVNRQHLFSQKWGVANTALILLWLLHRTLANLQ